MTDDFDGYVFTEADAAMLTTLSRVTVVDDCDYVGLLDYEDEQ